MPMTIVSRVAARAVISAALAAGSLSLTATAAGACTGSACGGGQPPVAAPLTCTTPDCTRGVLPDGRQLIAMLIADPPLPYTEISARHGRTERQISHADRSQLP